jgi:hypothetical protein
MPAFGRFRLGLVRLARDLLSGSACEKMPREVVERIADPPWDVPLLDGCHERVRVLRKESSGSRQAVLHRRSVLGWVTACRTPTASLGQGRSSAAFAKQWHGLRLCLPCSPDFFHKLGANDDLGLFRGGEWRRWKFLTGRRHRGRGGKPLGIMTNAISRLLGAECARRAARSPCAESC